MQTIEAEYVTTSELADRLSVTVGTITARAKTRGIVPEVKYGVQVWGRTEQAALSVPGVCGPRRCVTTQDQESSSPQ